MERSFSLFWVLSDRNPSFVWIIYSRSLDVSKELCIEMHSFPYLPSCSWRDYFQPVKILSPAIMGRGVDMMIMMMMPLWDDWWDTNTQWSREKGNLSVCWNSGNVKWKKHSFKIPEDNKIRISSSIEHLSSSLLICESEARLSQSSVLTTGNCTGEYAAHTLHLGLTVNTASGHSWKI